MSEKVVARGSWVQRFLIYTLSFILALLIYWLVGFFLKDLDNIPGPKLADYTANIMQSPLKTESDRLSHEITILQKDINAVQKQRGLLMDAMKNTQNTINQILEIQRMHSQKGQEVANEVTANFTQNTQLFLTQQNQLTQINNTISDLNMQLLPLQDHYNTVSDRLNRAREEANKLYRADLSKHRLNIGLFQIALLIVLLLIVVFFLVKKSSSYYRPIWMAISLAILIKTFFVIHDYFPSRYFKYVLTLSLIIVVVFALTRLLKRRAFPEKDYLIKQFRDAYEHFLCPICEYPIRRGPLRYAFWTRRSVKKIPLIQDHSEDKTPYNCPHCGTDLYQPCASCEQIRHSLLPFCEHCGAEVNVAN